MIVPLHRALALAGVAVATLTASPVLAQTPWIHVEVDEGTAADTRVKVNLPLSVVALALDAAPSEVVSRGRIHAHDCDIDIADLRRAWRELKDAGDAELVSVEGRDGNVAIRREGDKVRIDLTDRKDGGEVHVDVPVSVVDSLLSGEGDELNVRGAIDELRSLRGDVVRVDDGGTKVRVWIDERD
ncbi:MAG TPA: hypothetical protein VEK15_17765 [Vicinamibacteria bacterium]|nr:hypothetical protein [Vicinamibacteria bacterium]